MSDRPNDRKPDEPKNPRAANTPGGWRTPEQAAPGERHAWRTPEEQNAAQNLRVPTLPRDLSEKSGGWHLPQAQDTPYSPEDEIVIAPETPAPEAPPPSPPASAAAPAGTPAT